MIVMAIDPGYEQSAWILYDGVCVVEHGIETNDDLLRRLSNGQWRVGEITAVVIEQIESFGMAVGREVFETVFVTGRLFERARYRARADRLPRKAVKLHLCESNRATDSNIRVAILDRFGGKDCAIGKAKTPGPLYGIKSHEWAALAVAITWWDTKAQYQQTLQKGA